MSHSLEQRYVTSLTQPDYSLHRKGRSDQARHLRRVEEAIKGNLADIVGNGDFSIAGDGKERVRVRLPILDLPTFQYGDNQDQRLGAGDGKSKVGDVLGKVPGEGQGSGKGKQAGDQPGVNYIDALIDMDYLEKLIFEDLGLPNLKPKTTTEIDSEDSRFNDIRRKGPMSNLDKRRTILENVKRNAARGDPHFGGIKDEDLRFRTWSTARERVANAAIIAMRDVSGSMGDFEKYISRSFYYWMVKFLRMKYQGVQVAFVAHHTEAKEVDEETFFKLGESGGTRCSSAYELIHDMIPQRFPPDKWNVYPFHFSDGDNSGSEDNERCLGLLDKILPMVSMFGYGEIRSPSYLSKSTLMSAFENITDPRFKSLTIKGKKDVYPALKHFFGSQNVEGAVSRV